VTRIFVNPQIKELAAEKVWSSALASTTLTPLQDRFQERGEQRVNRRRKGIGDEVPVRNLGRSGRSVAQIVAAGSANSNDNVAMAGGEQPSASRGYPSGYNGISWGEFDGISDVIVSM